MNINAKKQIKKSNYAKGFTVLELVISISIVAIMAAIVVPNYLSYIPKARLNGATRMVMSDLMAARMRAVNQNTRTKVFFLNNSEYKICDDANGDGTVADGEGDAVLKDIQSEYPDVNLWFTSNPTFLPRGTATNDSASTWTWVVSWNGSSWRAISVNLTGRINIDYAFSYET